ncbi:uncharacterized protein LOC121927609 [Sceloporus undulatus]|uniref:uncharacterized protein LOC121927609 n=1 Tax=Sceloporus undulatus TaxID=8520 RepID=UPI001C4C89BD|nr:uncharacterized protein LOC121927609 [Sceloporus undulatus]XP_042317325.1 uncharacterized protein LOC121927609 [Sceloporus undulatus]XP_042317326.1 uncharacterized protein LOC121927609 [Sceloporus undulatus]XP_042317327.1 uncharacterized protein LOC121927609 [Sceloporus undulatus]
MSSKTSTVSDTESEWDFYSACWEENIVHTNKDSVDSGSESDFCLRSNSHHSLSEKRKGEIILGKAVLILENSETNFSDCCKHCPLLQAQKIDNAEEFQVELSPESVLCVNFKDCYTSGHSSKVYSSKISQSKCDGSGDDFYLNPIIPHVNITENSVTGKTFHSVKEAGFDKLHQKQSSFHYFPSSKHNKAVQVSFPSGETESEGDFVSECSKQSSVHANINKTSINKPSVFHSAESQLADTHLGYSNKSYKIDSPQTTEQIYFPTSSGELVISLTLEAAYSDPNASLTGNIISSDVCITKEDSRRHDLAFKCKGSQQNQLLEKLCISVAPCPVQVDTGNQTHIPPSTKQVGCSDILDAETSEFLAVNVESSEASQSLAADTESAESSCSDFHFNQGLSTLKLLAPCWFFPPTKHTHKNHSPHFCVVLFPDNKITSGYKTSEVEKEQPKASRCVKSVVFTKNKEAQKGKQFRSRHHISKFHRPKTLSTESINKNTQKAGEISEVCYRPLTHAAKCCCSPLLDFTVDLFSAGKDSERCLSVHRESHKRTRGGKVIPRFSSHHSLDPINNLDRFQYICPIKRKNNLKMQNILNYCLGWSGQNTQKTCEGNICPTPNSPCLPADGKTSIDPVLSNLRNSSVPLSTAVPLSNERRSSPCLQTVRSPAALYLCPEDQRQPSGTCIQTDRDTWSSGTSPHGRCNISHFPCENIVKVEQPQKERYMFTNTGVERLNCGANHVACGGSARKKPPVCPCGNMLQCGLFPNGEISESINKKTRASPNSHRRANICESDRIRSPVGSCNTEDACCGSCHHGFPPCFYNTCEQGASRNQIIKVASFFENGFPPKNLKNDSIEKIKAVKPSERKNVRFHTGSDTLQMYPSGTQPASPLNDDCETSKHYHYECSCCRTGTKEHLASSREGHCFGAEHKRLNGSLNRESIFLVDCGQETRSQCKCSQEIPLFRTDYTDMYNEKRPAVSTQKESDFQDSSRINDGWKRLDGNHKCCHNNVWYSH